MSHRFESICDRSVSIRQLRAAEYPESAQEAERLETAIESLCIDLNWSQENRGPFGGVVREGDRVVVKPNFVLDRNQGPWGMGPMITHPTIVRAVVRAVLRANPTSVLVGDAPIQSCDFAHLMEVTGLGAWANELKKTEHRFLGVQDFRRTTCAYINGQRIATENVLPEEHFVLFDLGCESLLEPITTPNEAFRVTCYDPRLMAKTHSPGKHHYLVAKDVIEADVIINLPKLKTHKKAGITCALKNLIGINGNKEYLPHHRIGGSNLGGDCYPGESTFKRLVEFAMDRQNLASSPLSSRAWSGVATQLNRALRVMGDDLGIEGSWAGNDTIWRTGLDLNRILIYGKTDGSIADHPQRKVIHLADAIIAGQGDGPLAPQPLDLALLVGGANAAAVDWVSACLLGYEPAKISIVREAFQAFRWPIATFSPNRISLKGDWDRKKLREIQISHATTIRHPIGWRSAKAGTLPAVD
jgi:uncharacterized protein (DUF362 family)